MSRRSIWLTLLNSTKIRFWLALKSSTTARIASASNPVHFSQYLMVTRPASFPEPASLQEQWTAARTASIQHPRRKV